MRDHYYILDKDRQPVPVPLDGWVLLEARDRVVEQTYTDRCWISTVFLGIDHNFLSEGPPLLFETMVFPKGGPLLEEEMHRYPTWDDAQTGHTVTVRRIMRLEAESLKGTVS